MQENHLWKQAEHLDIRTGPEITGGFDIGFDSKIPEVVRDKLMHFVYWVEDHFSMPITLWVDFKYNHYLMRQGERVGYRFYYADFKDYPNFDNPDDIPVIELPVRMEHSSIDEILFSFIEAISCYYAWLTNAPGEYLPDENQTAEILYTYLSQTNQEVDYVQF